MNEYIHRIRLRIDVDTNERVYALDVDDIDDLDDIEERVRQFIAFGVAAR